MTNHLDFPRPAPSRASDKLPFDLDEVLARLEEAVEDLPPPLHTALHAEGYVSVFQHLAIALISARTPDAVTMAAARQLFRWAPTPAVVHRLSPRQITSLVESVAFASAKAARLKEIASIAVECYEGELPCRERILRALPGVGPACANLALAMACGQDKIHVGRHVLRVTRRWGLVTAASPSGAESQLCEKLPRELWGHFGEWCTAFADHVCTRIAPRCHECPLRRYCRQVDVEL